MSFSLLIDQESWGFGGTDSGHQGIKLSWMVISSFSLHLVFFLGLFLLTPRFIPDQFTLQNHHVSLIAPKMLPTMLDAVQKFPSGGIIAPLSKELPAPPSTPPKMLPSVKNAEVNMEIPKSPILEKALPLPPAKFYPPSQEPAIPRQDIAANVPPPLASPSSHKEEKANPPETTVSPLDSQLPEKDGVSATISVGGNAGGASPKRSAFGYPYYLRSIEHKIGTQWAPPPASSVSTKRERAIAVIGFIVKQDGRIDMKSVSIEKSSGNSFFDMAALRAIHNANPLPPLPRGILDDLRVHFSFAVSLDS